MQKKWGLIIFTGFLLMLGACSHAPTSSSQMGSPEFPKAFYKNAIQQGEPVYQIDPQQSQAIIKVYRAGTLAHLGHDHVIASHDVQGYLLLPTQNKGKADLMVPLNLLTVDEPALRTQMGFNTQPTTADIEGTRQHMLDNTLDVTHYPFAYIHVDGFIDQPSVDASLTLQGVTHHYNVSITHQKNDDGVLIIAGAFTIKQTDFGITPFSVLGGMLQVQDAVDLQFNLHANIITHP